MRKCSCGKNVGIDGIFQCENILLSTQAIDIDGFLESFGVLVNPDAEYVYAMVLNWNCEDCDDSGELLILERTNQ